MSKISSLTEKLEQHSAQLRQGLQQIEQQELARHSSAIRRHCEAAERDLSGVTSRAIDRGRKTALQNALTGLLGLILGLVLGVGLVWVSQRLQGLLVVPYQDYQGQAWVACIEQGQSSCRVR